MVELLACLSLALVSALILLSYVSRRKRRLAVMRRREEVLLAIAAEGEQRAAQQSMDRALAAIEAGSPALGPSAPAPARVARALWPSRRRPSGVRRPDRAPRARRVAPLVSRWTPVSSPRLPFAPQRARGQAPSEGRRRDEEWEVPTRPARACAAASAPAPAPPRPREDFEEPPTRVDRPRRDPFDVATASYPSSLSVAHLYARSILSERRASES